MNDYINTNRDLWDQLAPIHRKSEFYEVDRFKQGECILTGVDRDEVGEVAGKSLLHLQCHFGLDTLCWARRGASVTGADFSEPAIKIARSLAAEMDLPAEFVASDLYDLRNNLSGEFDIVFTSGGVLTWLPDLTKWAETAAHFVKPGGRFYLREFHPMGSIFDDEDAPANPPRIGYPYFHQTEPMRFDCDGSYADPEAKVRKVSYEWLHSIADVVNALINADLTIEYLHEFPFISYQSHPFLVQSEDGNWRYPKYPESIPLMFSISATKGAQ